ncbi:endolytic transglycosylase MltG [Sphingomonas sp.]|uniref:endolytic transglycosylase MltG n=1 Tax=Sphingomonas sp. TaxID=28214 RepID=UPI003B00931A
MARRRPARGAGPLVVLAALALLVAGAIGWAWHGRGPLARPATVTIPQGATLATAARELEHAGAIGSARLFTRLSRLFGSRDPIRAGRFAIPARSSAAAILDLLQHGRPVLRLVTVPEGMASIYVRQALAQASGLTGPAPLPAEGSVLPDSYAFTDGDARTVVARRMRAAMDRALAEEWRGRAPGLAVRTPRDAVILASIVEKETGAPAERATVAAVYANRLRLGMPLQADPTVIYPVTRGRPLGRRILLSELRAVNGYNTYARPGLPIGPICNPGRASLHAVLHPASSKALYFVANGRGGHVFANTLAEQNANVKRWYAIRHARGEM